MNGLIKSLIRGLMRRVRIIECVALLPVVILSQRAKGESASAEFVPGVQWLDTDGKPVNAHGGGVLFHEGVYYWYGEFKSGKTYLPDCNKSWGGTRVDTTGVSCYSSTNLHQWKNEGIVLAAVTNNPQDDLYSGKVLERPKVIYNRGTGKFVMWMHIDSQSYGAAQVGVAVGDAPTGPFKYQGGFRPDKGVWPVNVTSTDKVESETNIFLRDFNVGQMSRDMTVFVDDDGKAYLFYSSEENPTMHVSLLSDDYLHLVGTFSRIFDGRSMEAPAVFKHMGKYYLIASGCTAWEPNAARSAVADNLMGPWKELGNPCLGKDSENTYHAQSTYVLPVQGRENVFIFMADRWNQWNLPDSRYVWLPIVFAEDGRPMVRWREHWSLEPSFQSRLTSLASTNTVSNETQ
jgi:hypothetical protein